MAYIDVQVNYETTGNMTSKTEFTIKRSSSGFDGSDILNLNAFINFISVMPNIRDLKIHYKYVCSGQAKLGALYVTNTDMTGYARHNMDLETGSLTESEAITEHTSSFKMAIHAIKQAIETDIEMICILDSLNKKYKN